MSSLADQIRELQLKLEKLNEAEPPPPEQSAMNVASDNVPQPAAPATSEPAPAPAPAADGIPTIEAGTFSQAYAKARKLGLKKFRWCGVYAVKDPVKPQPTPTPTVTSTVQPRFLGQGPSDAMLKDKNGNWLPKANQDLIRKSYDDSAGAI